jgi:hypothetical protein
MTPLPAADTEGAESKKSPVRKVAMLHEVHTPAELI